MLATSLHYAGECILSAGCLGQKSRSHLWFLTLLIPHVQRISTLSQLTSFHPDLLLSSSFAIRVVQAIRLHLDNCSIFLTSLPASTLVLPQPTLPRQPLFFLQLKIPHMTPLLTALRWVLTSRKLKFLPCSTRPHVNYSFSASSLIPAQVCTSATPTWLPPQDLCGCCFQLEHVSLRSLLHPSHILGLNSKVTTPERSFLDHPSQNSPEVTLHIHPI